MAHVLAVNAVLVQIQCPSNAPQRPIVMLGARYQGPVWQRQLAQWADRQGGWWSRCRSQRGWGPIQRIALHDAASLRPDASDRAIFDRLSTSRGLLLECRLPEARLIACVFLKPLSKRGVDRQQALLAGAASTIHARLSHVLSQIERTRPGPRFPLSPAEKAITPLLEQGLSEPAIADRLDKSRHTVHTHIRSIYRKLGVRSKRELRERANGRGKR